MSTFVDKPLSLIDRKKEQWAREREELDRLNILWNRDSIQSNAGSRNAPEFPKAEYNRRGSISSRKQSLPPLGRSQNFTYSSNEKLDKEMGGETSGYGSDSQVSPEHYETTKWNNGMGYESSSSGKEDRPRWGDKGVHVGKFWEPKEADSNAVNDPPGWLKRGLEKNTQLEVANTSPAESPEQDVGAERPCTSFSVSNSRSYIRGQNIHLQPEELAERERRRQVAMEHQEAVMRQLEEREKRRLEEREQRIREELEEERRIERDKAIERRRRENEEKLRTEKILREQKRKQAIQEAVETAEREAKREKMQHKLAKQNNVNNFNANDNVDKDKLLLKSPRDDIQIINNDISDYSEKEQKNNNNNLFQAASKREHSENDPYLHPPQPLSLNSCDSSSMSMVLQAPLATLQNMQFAVLMPASNNGGGPPTAVPIAVPITISTEGSVSARTENRILTPTQYRLGKRFMDSSTQTETGDFGCKCEKLLQEKLSSLDLSYSRRVERRMQERSVEERPKWGANRPPTRYMKQSDKDPLYLRRKQRQKMRQTKSYDKRSCSSDDSQPGSPRLGYRKNECHNEGRRGRALWHKGGGGGQNARAYQSDVLPLITDKDKIYYKTQSSCCCQCRCKRKYAEKRKKVVDILEIEHVEEDRQQLPPSYVNGTLESGEEVLQKLNMLHDGLLMKQERWQNTPTTPSLCCTPRRNSENIF